MAAFGIEDSEFIRGKVPMTKAEIRAMVMVKAAIQDNDIVADIGAGTGSLTIEAALCAKSGKVFAIEKNPEGIQLIKQNAEKFGYQNIIAIEGSAPDAMDGLPPLDVIIIGGTSGNMHKILDNAENLLKKGGRIVLTAVTAETTGEVENSKTALSSLRDSRCRSIVSASWGDIIFSIRRVQFLYLQQLKFEEDLC